MIETPPAPPPVPPQTRRKMYMAIWNNGDPMKAEMFTNSFPKWKRIKVEQYISIAEQFRAQVIIAEQQRIDREFGAMAMGL